MELDCEAMHELEPPQDNTWSLHSYRIATWRLRGLLEELVEEVRVLWPLACRSLYDLAVVAAPLLAHYSTLARGLVTAIEQQTRLQLREEEEREREEGGMASAFPLTAMELTVVRNGRVVTSAGDELLLWDDGLDGVRRLFLEDKRTDVPPLGPFVKFDSLQVRGTGEGLGEGQGEGRGEGLGAGRKE